MTEPIEIIEQQSRTEKLLRNRAIRIGIIWAVWTLVALFFSTQVYMMYYAESSRFPMPKAFCASVSLLSLGLVAPPSPLARTQISYL